MRTMLDVSAALGDADGGTAWVATLLNVCAWMTGTFPQQAQDDVWGEDPDALVCGVLAPTAETRKVEGGHQASGRWYYNSRSWHATWAIPGIPSPMNGRGRRSGAALIPRRELEYEETWFVARMRSTGSNCTIAKDVFVPDHRIVSVPPAIEGHYATEHTDQARTSRRSCRPGAGPGRAAARHGPGGTTIVRGRQLKSRLVTFFTAQADSVAFQLQLAEAVMLIHTAHLHAYPAADDIDEPSVRGVSRLPDARPGPGRYRLGHPSHRAGHQHPVVG